ncbi:MAG: Holliday junction branch migration protein RuvA [Candidatus Hydrogenedens sp.]|nr:Holliday junction branch migration protein RuvA [Candidatus Hydrogenedens sp.]
MFRFLRGVIAEKSAEVLALDVNGVGYEVHAPETVLRRLSVDQTATLLTYCHIREESFTIFGFLREDEKALFITLLSINKVGPKVALSILSAFTPSDFGRAVLDNNVDAFKKVSGVGKATAQRVILEMRNKMKQDADLNAILGEPAGGGADDTGDDVFEALVSLGCTPQEAKRVAAKARKELGDGATDEDLVRAALRSMSKAV